MLLEAPRPLREIPPAQWQRMRADDPQMLQDIQSCEALYGTDAVAKRADRVEIKIEEVLVIYRFDSLDPKRVEVRAKSTGDELVTQAALWLVQSFSGALALSDAVQLARGRAEASAPEPRSALLLATPSCRWLGLQQETAGVPLDFVSPKQAASQASRMIQKYLTSHKVFQPAGNAETVVNERLAERFAEKLEQMRIGSGSFVTPSLVFHGAGSQEVLRSICRRGFLMPGDWIEGTPDFLEMEHGNVKGVGVYTSPCLDTAARYGGIEDSEGRGLVLVALAAPGCCWHEKSRQKTQETIRSWFFPSGDVKVGTQHGGWVWQGDAWHPTGAGTSLTPDFAFAPVEALYDGRYHSRRYGIGTQVSEELVLASVDQLLPLLLVPFARRDAAPPAKPLPRLPGLKGPGQGRRHALMGSRIYAYPSEPLPERELTCSKLLAAAAPEEELWALHLPKGEKRRGKELNVIFLVDEALGASEFKAEVLTLLSAIGGQLQAPAAAATFNRQGIVQAGCVPFLPSDAAHASFASRWPRKGCEGAGDLAAALQHVTDMAISKLVKDTERRLQQAASPWAQLAAGHQLVTSVGRTETAATVTEVSFEGLKPSSLEVLWHGKAQKSKRLCVVNGDVPVLRVEFEEGEVDFLPPAKLRWGLDPGDVAAEMHFAVFVLSPFTAKDQASGGSLARLETTVQDCGLQLHCSGCRTSVIPLVLGGDASGARLAAFVQTSSNASGEWWMPFYGAETRAEVPGLLEQLQQDMSTWTAHWSEGTQGLVTLGPAAAKLGQGFLGSALGASQPTWELRLQSPSGEAGELLQGQCVLYKGELPRRDVWVDGEEYRLVDPRPALREPGWRLNLEMAYALEMMAQQLRSSSLASLGSTRSQIVDWVAKMRKMALELEPPPLVKQELEAWRRLPPPELAGQVARLRGLTCSLQRLANSLDEAAELQRAAEQEPSSAAWLRRASEMKYGAKALQRAKIDPPEDHQDQWCQQLETLTELDISGVGGPISMLTGCSSLEHLREMQKLAPELKKLRPQEAVYASGAVGLQLRCRRSDAAEVEPWLLLVEHVAVSWADTASAALSLDAGHKLRDAAGEEAPDVAVLAFSPQEAYRWFIHSAMHKSYLGMVFARNPLCQVPGQHMALPVILWVKTAELLIGRAPRDRAGEVPPQEADWFRAMLRIHLEASKTAQHLVQGRGSFEVLADALASADPTGALTEAEGGPQSVCLALAACCFSKKAQPAFWGKRSLERTSSLTLQRANSRTLTPDAVKDEDPAAWPRRLRTLALAMMAEAVSRACRRLVRSLCSTTGDSEAQVSKKLLWDALGLHGSVAEVEPEGQLDDPKLAKLEGHSDDCDIAHVQRRSALLFAPQGKYFQVALTNCTPQGIVGTLMIHMACMLQKADGDELVEKLMQQFFQRDISMKAFIEAVLPGDVSPGAVQAALYAQGLRYFSASSDRWIDGSSEPPVGVKSRADPRLSVGSG
ncbi:unnamed protein product [Effrenium voratum]|nr:unnamed protein product [Effrenium voratum]